MHKCFCKAFYHKMFPQIETWFVFARWVYWSRRKGPHQNINLESWSSRTEGFFNPVFFPIDPGSNPLLPRQCTFCLCNSLLLPSQFTATSPIWLLPTQFAVSCDFYRLTKLEHLPEGCAACTNVNSSSWFNVHYCCSLHACGCMQSNRKCFRLGLLSSD